MLPIDAKHHLLKEPEIQAIRRALHPRLLIPMHYRLPDLEPSPDTPEGLGEINPWLAGRRTASRAGGLTGRPILTDEFLGVGTQ